MGPGSQGHLSLQGLFFKMAMLTYKAAPPDSSSPTRQVPLGDIQLPPFGLPDRHTQYQCHLIVFLQILVTVAVAPPFPSCELTTFPCFCFVLFLFVCFCSIEKKDATTVWFYLQGAGDGTPGLYMLGSAQLRLLMIYWVIACSDAISH